MNVLICLDFQTSLGRINLPAQFSKENKNCDFCTGINNRQTFELINVHIYVFSNGVTKDVTDMHCIDFGFLRDNREDTSPPVSDIYDLQQPFCRKS